MSKQENILSLAEQVEEEFEALYYSLDVPNAPEKRKADIIDSIWGDIYKKVFKPGEDVVKYNNCKSKLKTYDVEAVQEVCEMFIKLCKRYGGVIKYNQFANLTGINRYTLYLWHKANKSNGYIVNLSNSDITEEYNYIYIINNSDNNIKYSGSNALDNNKLSTLRFDVIQKLQEEMQDANTNGLSNDTMGHAIRANNEEELGKLYEPKRFVIQQQAKNMALTAASLPSLGANNSQTIQTIADDSAVIISDTKATT